MYERRGNVVVCVSLGMFGLLDAGVVGITRQRKKSIATMKRASHRNVE